MDGGLEKQLKRDYEERQSMLSAYACRDTGAVRRRDEDGGAARTEFIRDAGRIINCRYFNRYADKTQVFSLYRNDDITRRILHVQIVSRIARNAGLLLKLNQDLIEAVSLGHDLGHAPFGHAGERFLSALLKEHTGRVFRHNVHSVRILDKIFDLNLSIQTLDGILCHNGLMPQGEYRPLPAGKNKEQILNSFDAKFKACCGGEEHKEVLVPATLEGCVVRISDIVAYLGKDRQDAVVLGLDIGAENTADLEYMSQGFADDIINSMVKNSYGKDYIEMDAGYSQALAREKELNYELIYKRQNDCEPYLTLKTMFRRMYERLLGDVKSKNVKSPIFRHHVNKIFAGFKNGQERARAYAQEEPNQLVTDYIASMTDDYFIDLHEHLFPGKANLSYISYFSPV